MTAFSFKVKDKCFAGRLLRLVGWMEPGNDIRIVLAILRLEGFFLELRKMPGNHQSFTGFYQKVEALLIAWIIGGPTICKFESCLVVLRRVGLNLLINGCSGYISQKGMLTMETLPNFQLAFGMLWFKPWCFVLLSQCNLFFRPLDFYFKWENSHDLTWCSREGWWKTKCTPIIYLIGRVSMKLYKQVSKAVFWVGWGMDESLNRCFLVLFLTDFSYKHGCFEEDSQILDV